MLRLLHFSLCPGSLCRCAELFRCEASTPDLLYPSLSHEPSKMYHFIHVDRWVLFLLILLSRSYAQHCLSVWTHGIAVVSVGGVLLIFNCLWSYYKIICLETTHPPNWILFGIVFHSSHIFFLFCFCIAKLNFEKCTVISVCTTMKMSNLPDMRLPQTIYCVTVLKWDLCLLLNFFC